MYHTPSGLTYSQEVLDFGDEKCQAVRDHQTEESELKKLESQKNVKAFHTQGEGGGYKSDSDFDDLDDVVENVVEETVDAATTRVSTVSALVTTAGVANLHFNKMKEHKAKEKGVAITDVEDSSRIVRLVRSITTLQPLPTIDPKDKVTASEENTGDYKHSELKGKTYEEIYELYERQQQRIQDFIPMDSEKEVIKDSGKKDDSSSQASWS
ncbi:hypothetical protein Tco_0178653 [Tanacetum coccineum]